MLRSASWWFGYWLLILLGVNIATAPTVAAEPLPAAMQAEFGAAAWIPEDAGYFAASYRYRERWLAFRQTQAYQEILTMPAVQMGLGWLKQQPYLDQLAMMRAQNPLLDDGVNVLQDAFSQEVFVYVDARGPSCINELGGLYNSLFFDSFLEGLNTGMDRNVDTDVLADYTEEKNQARLIRQMLTVQDDLRMPGVVFGFRLSDPQAGRDLLDSLAPLLQQTVPLPIQQESLGGGEYLTLALSATLFLNPQIQSEMEDDLRRMELDDETIAELVAFAQSQTLSISLGMRDDYLLISLGSDNTHLSNLGKGISLAASEALAPLRRHFQSRMIGLSYVHPDLTSYQKMDVDGLLAKLQELLQQMQGNLPAGLADRITVDATKLLNEINEALPVARPKVAASFWKDGIETFTFSALLPGYLESSKPLSILSHAGESPLLALAAHSPPSLPHYNRLVSWLQTFYGYFEDYAVPQIPEEDRAEFEQFESLALPALQELHLTTRDFLLPSLEGGQSLFVVDAGGMLSRSPDTKELLEQPIRFPRPAIIVEVNDTQKFVTACQQYRDTINSLMTEVAQQKPNVTKVQLPPPEQRQLGNGTLYTYSIPEEYGLASYLNDDFEPHVLLTSQHFVFSLSPQHSLQLLADNPLPVATQFDLQQPAGRATWFDFLVLKDLICDDANAILALVEDEGNVDINTSLLIQIHIDKLRKVLGAVHNYRSRTYEENGLNVTHSWFQLQDIQFQEIEP